MLWQQDMLFVDPDVITQPMDVDQKDDDLRAENAETVEKRRKSGKKRAADGHQAGGLMNYNEP